MPGFDPNEPRDASGKWVVDASSAMHKAASDKYTVGYAPYRTGNISNLNEAEKAFEEEGFKKWREQGTQLAQAMGINILSDNNTIGIYEATTDNAESSRVIEVSGDDNTVHGYAALMGALAPDVQMSVMVNKYVEAGGDATEKYINFNTKQAALNFVTNRKSYGINDLSYSPDKNQVLILDFGNFAEEKFLSDHGTEIKNVEHREVQTRFIEEREYGGIIRQVRGGIEGHQQGTRGEVLNNLLTQAEEKIKPK